MKFRDIAVVSGKPQLFKVADPTKNGVILETLDKDKRKIVSGIQNNLTLLSEISIFTTTEEQSIPLPQLLIRIYEQYQKPLELTKKSNPKDLNFFFSQILPEYDREKVYVSDIKKVVTWYNILIIQVPKIFSTETKNESSKI